MSEQFSGYVPAMGLTQRMKDALDAVTKHVALHGSMPSRRQLASEIGCNPNNAQRLIKSLIERGELNSMTAGGPLTGFGHSGIAVFVPHHLMSHLADFCASRGETIQSVVADAIALHLDELDGAMNGAAPGVEALS